MKTCGTEALDLMAQLKTQDSLATTDSSGLRAALDNVQVTAQVNICSLFTDANERLAERTRAMSMLSC